MKQVTPLQTSVSGLLALYSCVSALLVAGVVIWLLVYNAYSSIDRQFASTRESVMGAVVARYAALPSYDSLQLQAYTDAIVLDSMIDAASIRQGDLYFSANDDVTIDLSRRDSFVGEHEDKHFITAITREDGTEIVLAIREQQVTGVLTTLKRNTLVFIVLYLAGVLIAVSICATYLRTRFFFLKQMALAIARGREPRTRHYFVRDLEQLSQCLQKVSKQQKQRESLLRYSWGHDALTGLPNREQFQFDLIHRTAKLPPSENIALILIDIDRFKQVNDSYGHMFGDRLLRFVGLALSRHVTRKKASAARMGSDEFGVLLPFDDESQLDHFCRGILKRINGVALLEGVNVAISLRMGVATIEGQAEGFSAERLLHRADTALANAKKAHIAVCYHDETLFKQNRRFSQVMRSMKEGEYRLSQSGFDVHYQPKYDLKTGQMSGVEALVRWRHPTLGYIEAQDIINAASQSSLLGDITLRIVDIVIETMAYWRENDVELKVAINIGPSEVTNTEFAHYLLEKLQDKNMGAELIELEVTEHAVLDQDDRIRQRLKLLKEAGFTIAIDDFGVGYANFRNLRAYPFTTIKIDRDFISEMLVNPRDRVIVHATLQLARELGMTVVAEGVEDAHCAQELIRFGCCYVQGYLFSKPLHREELIDCYRSSHARQLISSLNARVGAQNMAEIEATTSGTF